MKHVNPFKHTTAEDYEHFLSYMWASGARHNALLCKAYFDGADAPHEEYEAYMTAHPEQTEQEQAEQEPVACGCGATAYCLIRHTNLPEHNFTPICLSCLQEHEQNAQEVNEHEMNNFGGAYGLVTWETKPLYAAPVEPVKQEPVAWIDIGEMVNRFLGWKLPSDFSPDCGITFKREPDYEHPVYGKSKYEPVGTNLFTADQAKAMFEYCLRGVQQAEQEPVGYFTYDGDYNIWEEVFSKDTYGAKQLYAAPVHAKDLTDDEIADVFRTIHVKESWSLGFARAVIKADRELNK